MASGAVRQALFEENNPKFGAEYKRTQAHILRICAGESVRSYASTELQSIIQVQVVVKYLRRLVQKRFQSLYEVVGKGAT